MSPQSHESTRSTVCGRVLHIPDDTAWCSNHHAKNALSSLPTSTGLAEVLELALVAPHPHFLAFPTLELPTCTKRSFEDLFSPPPNHPLIAKWSYVNAVSFVEQPLRMLNTHFEIVRWLEASGEWLGGQFAIWA